jgi:uncharacterized protein YutE (UPF0331/DUF86 family)
MNWMEFLASLVSSLAWPVTAVVVAIMLKNPITETLRDAGLKRFKVGPLELELWDRKLQEVRTEVEGQAQIAVQEHLSPNDTPAEELAQDALGLFGQIEQLSRISPKAAILESYRQLEEELRPLLEDRLRMRSSEDRRRRPRSLGALAREANRADVLDAADLDIINDLSALRNAVAHEAFDVDVERALSYADLVRHAFMTMVGRLSEEADEGVE